MKEIYLSYVEEILHTSHMLFPVMFVVTASLIASYVESISSCQQIWNQNLECNIEFFILYIGKIQLFQILPSIFVVCLESLGTMIIVVIINICVRENYFWKIKN